MGLFGKKRGDIAKQHNKVWPSRRPLTGNDIYDIEDGFYETLETDTGGKDWSVYYCLNCSHCVGYGKPDDKFCGECGNKIRKVIPKAILKQCKKCSSWRAKTEDFCGECGEKY